MGMNYEITVNQLNKGDGNIRAFASVVFEESFKVSNIAVIENKEGQCFVSMPRYASSKADIRISAIRSQKNFVKNSMKVS